jgi:hypothetical protein
MDRGYDPNRNDVKGRALLWHSRAGSEGRASFEKIGILMVEDLFNGRCPHDP